MMRFLSAFFALLLIAFVCSPLSAQDEGKEDESGGRLPPYYREIIKLEQKEQIYEIQKKYDDLIEPLEEKISELKSEEAKEVEAVLTPKQREILAKLKAFYKAEAKRRKEFLESLKGNTTDPTTP